MEDRPGRLPELFRKQRPDPPNRELRLFTDVIDEQTIEPITRVDKQGDRPDHLIHPTRLRIRPRRTTSSRSEPAPTSWWSTLVTITRRTTTPRSEPVHIGWSATRRTTWRPVGSLRSTSGTVK
ncbi:hypothetical protein HanIR_Chr17g0850851 [Helianthus annuus]|nr:hypothetical protein HanIR_Chr17g0850851 [Helianthus annuus]